MTNKNENKNKSLRTKDRKKIIRNLNLKHKLMKKMARQYYEKFQLADAERVNALWFIRCYGNYIMKNGTKRDRDEFKRLLKAIGGDKARWL